MRILITTLLIFIILRGFAQNYIPGYQSTIAGEELQYHSPQPDAGVSLLVRSEDSTRFIAWESATVPGIWNLEPGTLLLLAGIDVNPENPHSWKVYINDRLFFTISSPADTLTKILTWHGPEGSSLVFRVSEVDKYGDIMGYLFCNLPSSIVEKGKPVRFKVVGESAGSRTWFMIFKYTATNKVSLFAEQAILRGEKGNSQVLRAEIVQYDDPIDVKIVISGKKLKKTLGFGYNVLYLPVPEIKLDTDMRIVIRSGKKDIADEVFTVQPVKFRKIYLLHHSHNDIGYTDVQPEVEKKQWENLDNAIRIAGETKDFPQAAQMKWCTEVMWAVESWYDKASADQKQAFREAVRSGHLELDGLFANELVSLCGPEELDRLLEAGRRIARECGVNLTSAMITDIPGWSWSIVPALANSGVKYFSIGTNRGDRIGDILKAWGDKPFYWISPSGEEKVLCWIHGEGYSLFHTGLAYTILRKRLQEDLVFGYLARLAENEYPYEEVMLRYNIGSDNGPVDETLPQSVKEWNDKYITPQIAISTVDEAFSTFEKNHGADLPKVSGDLTGYWEDGAYSTARETAINRGNASRLTQAQALWAMYNPAGYPQVKMQEAWRNVLLFDEHTWGSWNSVSEPDSPFTLQQWEIKKSFALTADKQSKKLLSDAMVSKVLGGPAVDALEVINTCSWTRSGIATIPGIQEGLKVTLTDLAGNEIPSQNLSDGTIVFIAKDIPAFGSKIYKIYHQKDNNQTLDKSTNQQIDKASNHPIIQSSNQQILNPSNPPINQSSNHFESTNFILTINSSTGALSSFILKNTGEELVNNSSYAGLNSYLYVDGRLPDHPFASKFKSLVVLEDGPVVKTIRVLAEAPGCNSLTTDIRIFDDLNLVEITNIVDKKKIIRPEAVHIAFPFNIPGGTVRYDLAYGYCRPELDQLPGSNKNFLAMEHWLDISGEKSGVTVICPDAPLFEEGKISMDEKYYGWVDSLPPTRTFFSYLMNNYWETNYAASQEGKGSYRYIIIPHDKFDASVAEKEAIAQRQPLITRPVGNWLNEKPSLIRLENSDLIVTSIKPLNSGSQLLISIYNAGNHEEIPEWNIPFKEIYLSDPDGLKEEPFDGKLTIPPQGIRYLKVRL